MLQLALSFVLVMSSIIIWFNTHETDPLTESRITKLPPDTVKIEKVLLMQDFLLSSYLLWIQVLCHWSKQEYENQHFFGWNKDSQHDDADNQETYQKFKSQLIQIIIFDDMLEHQQFRIIMTSKYNGKEGIPFWIGVGAHGQKWKSSLDRKINHLTIIIIMQ